MHYTWENPQGAMVVVSPWRSKRLAKRGLHVNQPKRDPGAMIWQVYVMTTITISRIQVMPLRTCLTGRHDPDSQICGPFKKSEENQRGMDGHLR